MTKIQTAISLNILQVIAVIVVFSLAGSASAKKMDPLATHRGGAHFIEYAVTSEFPKSKTVLHIDFSGAAWVQKTSVQKMQPANKKAGHVSVADVKQLLKTLEATPFWEQKLPNVLNPNPIFVSIMLVDGEMAQTNRVEGSQMEQNETLKELQHLFQLQIDRILGNAK